LVSQIKERLSKAGTQKKRGLDIIL
jgi:hypothetical protein